MQAKKLEFTHVAVARPFEFTNDERCLLVEALNRAATRQESEARFKPQVAGPHDLKAARMCKLAARIAKGGVLAALIALGILAAQPASAGCVAYQVCQTCYRPDGTSYTCNCHMECLPGIHADYSQEACKVDNEYRIKPIDCASVRYSTHAH